MSDPVRYQVALIGEVGELRTRHAAGLPGGPQEELPRPDVLVLEVQPDGAAMLFRFTAGGAFCGDTWHESAADAREQAAWEYEGALGMWAPVPPGYADAEAAHRYARRLRGSAPRR